MQRPTTSDQARRGFEAVRDEVGPAFGATAGQMMGMPTLYVGGKAFAGLWGDAMVFKLEGADHARALALGGAQLFDPSGVGRPMKAWVAVPIANEADWPDLARLAAESLAKAG